MPGHDIPPDDGAYIYLRGRSRKDLKGGEYLADDAAVAVELAVVAPLISLSVGALPVATGMLEIYSLFVSLLVFSVL